MGSILSLFFLPKNINEQELLKKIELLNNDSSVHEILVQLPLPEHLNGHKVLESINPKKDVDYFHPFNVGNLYTGVSDFVPVTSVGIMMILDSVKDQWSI